MINRTQPVSPFLQAIRDHMMVVEQLEHQLELFEQIADRMIRAPPRWKQDSLVRQRR